MAVKIQAREIVRYARRNNLKIARQGIGGKGFPHCARAVLAHMLTGDGGNLYSSQLSGLAGKTPKDIRALEVGFEDGKLYEKDVIERVVGWGITKNRYFKVGKRVAELAGL